MGLIFSLLNVASAQEVPFEAPLFIKYTLHGLTSAFTIHLLITMKSVDFAVHT